MWVYACKFSVCPWATPTHSDVTHSMRAKDAVKQGQLCLNVHDCRLAVFYFSFRLVFYAYWTLLLRQQSGFCFWGVASQDKRMLIIHNSHRSLFVLNVLARVVSVATHIVTSCIYVHIKRCTYHTRDAYENAVVRTCKHTSQELTTFAQTKAQTSIPCYFCSFRINLMDRMSEGITADWWSRDTKCGTE